MRLGEPTGSAMPLMWAHAEYVKLLRSAADGKVFDQIPEVAERYLPVPPTQEDGSLETQSSRALYASGRDAPYHRRGAFSPPMDLRRLGDDPRSASQTTRSTSTMSI